MTSFAGIETIAKRLGDRVSGSAGTVGGSIWDPFGVGNFGKKFGEDMQLGVNIPTSFSLEHNITSTSTIDISGRVEVGVTVDFKLGQLVEAARLLRDGLNGFDIFGGLMRQLTNDRAAASSTLNMLRELKYILNNGYVPAASDRYFIDVALVNDSTQYVSTERGEGYEVQVDCACEATIRLLRNEETSAFYLAEIEMDILKSSGAPTAEPIRRVERIHLDNAIQRGDTSITVLLDVNGPERTRNPSSDIELSRACRMQIRLIRQTSFWNHTVFEAMFEGRSDYSTYRIYVPLGESQVVPRPRRIQRVEAVAKKLDALIESLGSGTFAPDVEKRDTPFDVIQQSLLSAFSNRLRLTNDIAASLREIDSEMMARHPGGIDVRTPVFFSISFTRGAVSDADPYKHGRGISFAASVVSDEAGVKPIPFIGKTKIGGGDEITARIPLDTVGMGNDGRVYRVEVDLSIGMNEFAPDDVSLFVYSLYSGYEWDKRLLGRRQVRIIHGPSGQEGIPKWKKAFEFRIVDASEDKNKRGAKSPSKSRSGT